MTQVDELQGAVEITQAALFPPVLGGMVLAGGVRVEISKTRPASFPHRV